MTPEPPSKPLDLLVVGGLTVDRFADATDAPGGAVTHIARAAAGLDLRVGVVTVAGPEPVAAEALAELRSVASAVEVTPAPATITYRHREAPTGRRLWLERTGGRVVIPLPEPDHLFTHAVLFAPVGGEIAVADLAAWAWVGRRGAILQGWLRTAGEGEEVRPRPLSKLEPDVLAALHDLSLIVASREDLAAEPGDGPELVAALRRAVGPGPSIVITDGGDGLWVQRAHGDRLRLPSHVAPRTRVEGVPTVGAGDILAALLLIDYGHDMTARLSDEDWVRPAMDSVERILEARRRPAPTGG